MTIDSLNIEHGASEEHDRDDHGRRNGHGHIHILGQRRDEVAKGHHAQGHDKAAGQEEEEGFKLGVQAHHPVEDAPIDDVGGDKQGDLGQLPGYEVHVKPRRGKMVV